MTSPVYLVLRTSGDDLTILAFLFLVLLGIFSRVLEGKSKFRFFASNYRSNHPPLSRGLKSKSPTRTTLFVLCVFSYGGVTRNRHWTTTQVLGTQLYIRSLSQRISVTFPAIRRSPDWSFSLHFKSLCVLLPAFFNGRPWLFSTRSKLLQPGQCWCHDLVTVCRDFTANGNTNPTISYPNWVAQDCLAWNQDSL